MPEGTSTNRQALSPCFILDGAVRVIRVARCFPPRGQRPFTYLGTRVLHRLNESGGDIHDHDDIVQAETLLKEMGWEEAENSLRPSGPGILKGR